MTPITESSPSDRPLPGLCRTNTGSGDAKQPPRPGDGPRRTVARAAETVLLALVVSVASWACGGEDSGQADDRFSISDRGVQSAVDSVRTERQRSAPRAGGQSGSQAASSLPPDIQATLDSGNAAYRTGDYQTALEQYESITADHPDVRAAWFGAFMAHRAMGNATAADSAMRRAGMGDSDAMQLHGATADSDSSTAPHDFTSDTTKSSM